MSTIVKKKKQTNEAKKKKGGKCGVGRKRGGRRRGTEDE